MSYDSAESSGEALPATHEVCVGHTAAMSQLCARLAAGSMNCNFWQLAWWGKHAALFWCQVTALPRLPRASRGPLPPPLHASSPPAHPNPNPPSDFLHAPPSPLRLPRPRSPATGSHRDHGAQTGAVLYDPAKNEAIPLPNFALRSGPRKTIYHSPKDVTAAIVTCEPQGSAWGPCASTAGSSRAVPECGLSMLACVGALVAGNLCSSAVPRASSKLAVPHGCQQWQRFENSGWLAVPRADQPAMLRLEQVAACVPA